MGKNNKGTWKIYILTLIAFIVGTSQFCIAGLLDKVASSTGISVSLAGYLDQFKILMLYL